MSHKTIENPNRKTFIFVARHSVLRKMIVRFMN